VLINPQLREVRGAPKSGTCNTKIPSFATFSFPRIMRRKRSGGEPGERENPCPPPLTEMSQRGERKEREGWDL